MWNFSGSYIVIKFYYYKETYDSMIQNHKTRILVSEFPLKLLLLLYFYFHKVWSTVKLTLCALRGSPPTLPTSL